MLKRFAVYIGVTSSISIEPAMMSPIVGDNPPSPAEAAAGSSVRT